MTPTLQAAAIATVTLSAGPATLRAMNDDVADMAAPEMAWGAGTALDGRSFFIEALRNTDADLQTDVLRFEDGTFLSEGIEKHSAFGLTGYRTNVDGRTIHFTVSPVCDEAPHSTTWYGTDAGDVIAVEMSWTTRRWYWTHQITRSGEGNEVTPASLAQQG